MERNATVQWSGGLKDGMGQISTQSGAMIHAPYGFATRFQGQPGTNPEELIAAAHSSCYSMALSAALADLNLEPQSIHTEARVSLIKDGAGWIVKSSHLVVEAVISGLNTDTFLRIAELAKNQCPISRLLRADITLEAKLLSNEKQFPTAAP